MQRDSTVDDDQRQEPDWELASYGHRVGAWLMDGIFLILLMFATLLMAQLALFTGFYAWQFGDLSDVSVDMPMIFWAYVTLFWMLMICYIVWWVIALRNGQTPGKQVVGIRVIKDSGESSNWGYTFLREFVIKVLVGGLLFIQTLGILPLVDYLWPLWDRAEKMQTLHDKMLGTIVVKK